MYTPERGGVCISYSRRGPPLFTFDYYVQRLEQKIIIHLADMKGVDVSVVMDWYYRSRLADQISRNEYDMAFLDSKYLARDLMENEPELFRHG